MGNLSITNCDQGGFQFYEGTFSDDLLTFAGAGTIKEGTILARDSVSKKLVPYVKGGVTNENGIPKVIIDYEVVATGAGDISVRVMVEGKGSLNRIVIAADGDNTNVDKVVIDQVRQYANINLLKEQELSSYDNQ